tara:strand:+ start:28764 stop:30095 length:1332 start_codon:yes stop_codon:yes gene_type:complete
MTLRLLLVRHGLSSFNKDLRIQGRNDLSTLTIEGKQQAIEAGIALANLPIHSVYSSPLQRAVETTKNIISEHKTKLNPIYAEGLLEIDLEEWSGLTKNEVKERFPEQYLTWQKDPKELVLKRKNEKEYKPLKELMGQAKTFLDDLLRFHGTKENKTILVVGHNAILRCLLLKLLGDPAKGFRRVQLDNASISIININSNKTNPYDVQLECLNSTSHLKPSLPSNKNHSRLILVRHGETDWNLQGRFQGQIDIPLNQNGKKQAKAAGEFLKNIKINKAYSSSLSRPKETAQIILESHPGVRLKLKEKLIEIGHGLWEGKLNSEIESDWPEMLQDWQNSPETVQMPEGESIQEVWQRSVHCWEEISTEIEPNQTALVVAHDAVNKTILCNLLGLKPSNIWMIKQGNGGITIVDICSDPSQPDTVTCLNITSHLGGIIDNTATGAL